MRIQQTGYYILREFRDLVEFVLLPGLAVVLPWSWSFRIFRRAARWNWLYRRYCRGAFEQASRFVEINDADQWRQRHRLLWLMDAAEFYIARFRPRSFMRPDRYEVVGQWPQQGHFIATGLHWGVGGLVFRDMHKAGYQPRLIFNRNVLPFAQQSIVENLYRRWRPNQYTKIGGGEPIATLGGYRDIARALRDEDVLIVILDAPVEAALKPAAVTILDKPARLRGGIVSLLADSHIAYVKYRLSYDFETGRRRLEISPAVKADDKQAIAADLAAYLDAALRQDSSLWYLWRQAPLFFD